MDEALHPLTILGVGLYGEVLPNQNGAPLRLVVPWKYGFKGIKSIVKIRFVERQPISSWQGTMAWHHRQRYLVQHARFSLLTADAAAAKDFATNAADDAASRGSRRYQFLGRAYAAVAAARLGEPLEKDDVDAVLGGLDQCAAPEAWLVTAELAAASGEDRWWRDAERRAGALIGNAGENGESLRQWVGARFSALGRR